MAGHSHIHSHSLKKAVLLTTAPLPSQWLVISVLNWEGSQLTIPSFQRSVYLTSTEGFAAFFFCFFSADLYCGILANTAPAIGKPHLSNARNKTAPGRLEPCHHKSTLSSAFYPLRVCVCVCVFVLAPKGLPRVTRVDVKAHGASLSLPRSDPHALIPPHASFPLLPQGPSCNPSHYFCLFHRRFQNEVHSIRWPKWQFGREAGGGGLATEPE